MFLCTKGTVSNCRSQKHVMVVMFWTLPIMWSALAGSQAESGHDKWKYNKSITHWALKQWIFHAEIAGPNRCWSRRHWETLFQHLIKQRWMSFGESVKVECVCQGWSFIEQRCSCFGDAYTRSYHMRLLHLLSWPVPLTQVDITPWSKACQ